MLTLVLPPAPALAGVTTPAATAGQGGTPLTPAVREEARHRFDRGLALFNQGDLAGALAEFERTYALTGHPVVLYNLGLVRASMGDAAGAVDAFRRLQDDGLDELEPEQRRRLAEVLEAQRRHVGTLVVTSNVPGTAVQIDGIDVATTPCPPIAVTAGIHRVALAAPGYAPRHLQVTVAGQAEERLPIVLVPAARPSTLLRVISDLPDVTIRVAGEEVARTPVVAPVVVPPGEVLATFERPGYVSTRKWIVLPPGETVTLAAALEPSPDGLREGGTLELQISEPQAVVWVDGVLMGSQAAVRLPKGRHALRVERAGFFPVTREVELDRAATRLDIHLQPRPEHLAAYVRRTRGLRVAGAVTLGTGVAAMVGSGAFLGWNRGQIRAAERAFDRYEADVLAMPEHSCGDICVAEGEALIDRLDRRMADRISGWVVFGVGAAVTTAGVLLLALGGNPRRYDAAPNSNLFSALRVGWGPGALSLRGRF